MDEQPVSADAAVDPKQGTWVVVTAGTTRLIGRVTQVNGTIPDKTPNPMAVWAVLEARILTLNPCYDFFAPLRPVPIMDPRTGQPIPGKMGMARDPIVTGRDFSLHAHAVHIMLGPGVVIDFFSQMHHDDADMLHDFTAAADKNMMETRAARSGLVLSGGQRGRT